MYGGQRGQMVLVLMIVDLTTHNDSPFVYAFALFVF